MTADGVDAPTHDLATDQLVRGTWRVVERRPSSHLPRMGPAIRYRVREQQTGKYAEMMWYDDVEVGRAEVDARMKYRSTSIVGMLDHGSVDPDEQAGYYICLPPASTLADVVADANVGPTNSRKRHSSAQVIVRTLSEALEALKRAPVGVFSPSRISVLEVDEGDVREVCVDPVFIPAGVGVGNPGVELSAYDVAASIGDIVVWLFTGGEFDDARDVAVDRLPAGWRPLVAACRSPHPPFGQGLRGLVPDVLDEPPAAPPSPGSGVLDALSTILGQLGTWLRRSNEAAEARAPRPSRWASFTAPVRSTWAFAPVALVGSMVAPPAIWALTGEVSSTAVPALAAVVLTTAVVVWAAAATRHLRALAGHATGLALAAWLAPWFGRQLGAKIPAHDLRPIVILLLGVGALVRLVHANTHREGSTGGTTSLVAQVRQELDAALVGVAQVVLIVVVGTALQVAAGWFGLEGLPTWCWAVGAVLLIAVDANRQPPGPRDRLTGTSPTEATAELVLAPVRLVVTAWTTATAVGATKLATVAGVAWVLAAGSFATSFWGHWVDIVPALEVARPTEVPRSLADLPSGPVAVLGATLVLVILLAWSTRSLDRADNRFSPLVVVAGLAIGGSVLIGNLPPGRGWVWWLAILSLALLAVAGIARTWWSEDGRSMRRRTRVVSSACMLAAILETVLLVGVGLNWYPALEVGRVRPFAGLSEIVPMDWRPSRSVPSRRVASGGDTTLRVGGSSLRPADFPAFRRWLLGSGSAPFEVEVVMLGARIEPDAAGTPVVLVNAVIELSAWSDVSVDLADRLVAVGSSPRSATPAGARPIVLPGVGSDIGVVEPAPSTTLWAAPISLYVDTDGDGVAETPVSPTVDVSGGTYQVMLASFAVPASPGTLSWVAVGLTDEPVAIAADGGAVSRPGADVSPVGPFDSWGMSLDRADVVDYDEVRIPG